VPNNQNKLFSIDKLLSYPQQVLERKVFKLFNPNKMRIIGQSGLTGDDDQRYVQIKLHCNQINDK
jgi:signal transduction histidine kinase